MTVAQRVSIHARPIGRAMRCGCAASRGWSMFQSTPGQLAGRCRYPPSVSVRRPYVSIHARPIGRAMPSAARCPAPINSGFNPRPANWPGDAPPARRRCAARSAFQSTPGQLAGRCVRDSPAIGASCDVSIHARPIGRAMRASCWLCAGVQELFQSTPGQLAGRCGCIVIGQQPRVRVSIHARPIGRAMPPRSVTSVAGPHRVSIHARPIGRAMPRATARGRLRACRFQSTPGQLAGRCASHARRPASAIVVSIHARPIGRAMPQLAAAGLQVSDVSIHARPIGRAMRARQRAGTRICRVSIHARPIGRAMPLGS